jgi:hypothetical protein
MDRDEAIRLLRGGPEGIKEWNQRGGQEVVERFDLSEANLEGASLSECFASAGNGETPFPS